MSARKERDKDRAKSASQHAPQAAGATGAGATVGSSNGPGAAAMASSTAASSNNAAQPSPSTASQADAAAAAVAAATSPVVLSDDQWRCFICAAIPTLPPTECDPAYLASFADILQSGARTRFACITPNAVLEWALDNAKRIDVCKQVKTYVDANPRGTQLPDELLARLLLFRLTVLREDMLRAKRLRLASEDGGEEGGNGGKEGNGAVGGSGANAGGSGTQAGGGGGSGAGSTAAAAGAAGNLGVGNAAGAAGKPKDRKDSPLKRVEDDKKKKPSTTGAGGKDIPPSPETGEDKQPVRRKEKLRDRVVAKPKVQSIDDEPADGPDAYIVLWDFRSSRLYQLLINDYAVPISCFLGMEHVKPITVPAQSSGANAAAPTAPSPVASAGTVDAANRARAVSFSVEATSGQRSELPWRVFPQHPALNELETHAEQAPPESRWKDIVFAAFDCERATDTPQLFDMFAGKLFDVVHQEKMCELYYKQCTQLTIPQLSAPGVGLAGGGVAGAKPTPVPGGSQPPAAATFAQDAEPVMDIYNKVMAATDDGDVCVELILAAVVEEVVCRTAPAESPFGVPTSTFSELSVVLDKSLRVRASPTSLSPSLTPATPTAAIGAAPPGITSTQHSHPSIDLYYAHDALVELVPRPCLSKINPLLAARKIQDTSRINMLFTHLQKLQSATEAEYREGCFRNLLGKSDVAADTFETFSIQLRMEQLSRMSDMTSFAARDWRWAEELDHYSVIGVVETSLGQWACPQTALDVGPHGALLLVGGYQAPPCSLQQFDERFHVPARLGFGLFYQQHKSQAPATSSLTAAPSDHSNTPQPPPTAATAIASHPSGSTATTTTPAAAAAPASDNSSKAQYVYNMDKQHVSFRRLRRLLYTPDGGQILVTDTRGSSGTRDGGGGGVYMNISLGAQLATLSTDAKANTTELLLHAGERSTKQVTGLFVLAGDSTSPQLYWTPASEYICWFTEAGEVMVVSVHKTDEWTVRKVTPQMFSVQRADGSCASKDADGRWTVTQSDGKRLSQTSNGDKADEGQWVSYSETDPIAQSQSTCREDGVTTVKRHDGSILVRYADGVVMTSSEAGSTKTATVHIPSLGTFSFTVASSTDSASAGNTKVTSTTWTSHAQKVQRWSAQDETLTSKILFDMGQRWTAETSPADSCVALSVHDDNPEKHSRYTVNMQQKTVQYDDRLGNVCTVDIQGQTSGLGTAVKAAPVSQGRDEAISSGSCLRTLLAMPQPFSTLCSPLPALVWVRKDGTGKLLSSDLHLSRYFADCVTNRGGDTQVLEEPSPGSDNALLVNVITRLQPTLQDARKCIMVRHCDMSPDLHGRVQALAQARESLSHKQPPVDGAAQAAADPAATSAINDKIQEIAGTARVASKLTSEALLEHFVPSSDRRVMQAKRNVDRRRLDRSVYADPNLSLIRQIVQRPQKLPAAECLPERFPQVRVKLREEFKNFAPIVPPYFESEEGKRLVQQLQHDQDLFVAKLRDSRQREQETANSAKKADVKEAEEQKGTEESTAAQQQVSAVPASVEAVAPLPKERTPASRHPRSNKSAYLRMRATSKQAEGNVMVLEAPTIRKSRHDGGKKREPKPTDAASAQDKSEKVPVGVQHL
ncbi:hypothetical protein RI367_008254 [Sorochytrium milnesiophthora]